MPSEDKKPFLPKWAQAQQERDGQTIVALTERVAELEATLAGDGTSLFMMAVPGEVRDFPLPGSVRHMRVKLPNGFEIDIQPQSDGNGGIGTKDSIQIMVVSHHGLIIAPQSGNVVQLEARRN